MSWQHCLTCLQGQTDHSKWAVTIPDSSGAGSSSRKLLHQDLTAGAAEEDLSRALRRAWTVPCNCWSSSINHCGRYE